MGIRFYCPNAVKKDRNEMLICRLDRCLCVKQQYCPAKRMYENTAGAGNCEKRKGLNRKPEEKRKGEKDNGENA